MPFAIIRDAPPREPRHRGGTKGTIQRERNRYPFAELDVGDAFDVPIAAPVGGGRFIEYSRLAATIHNRNKSSRSQHEVGIVGNCVRCWRIA